MSFISFNFKHFKNNIIKRENEPISRENLYRAKLLLKITDDLTDKGCTDLFGAIEEKFSDIKRLCRYLSKNN